MNRMAWHYTTGIAAVDIMRSVTIRPATGGIAATEKPVVWFSTNPHWEHAARIMPPTAAVLAICINLLSIAHTLWDERFGRPLWSMLGLIIPGVLLYNVFHGRDWARVILLVLALWTNTSLLKPSYWSFLDDYFFDHTQHHFFIPSEVIWPLVTSIAQLGAAVLLFSRNAGPWFRRGLQPGPGENGARSHQNSKWSDCKVFVHSYWSAPCFTRSTALESLYLAVTRRSLGSRGGYMRAVQRGFSLPLVSSSVRFGIFSLGRTNKPFS